MMSSFYKSIIVLFVAITLSCSAYNTNNVKKQPAIVPVIPVSKSIDNILIPEANLNSEANLNPEADSSPDKEYEASADKCKDGEDYADNSETPVAEVISDELPVAEAVDSNENLAEYAEDPENKDDAQNLLDTALDFCNASQDYWSKGDLELAIQTLDQAYSLVLQVNEDVSPDLIQQKDDLRFLISKRILELYSTRYTAVNGNYNEIPMTLNEHVEMEIKSFQGRERNFFIESYARSGKYMPAIREAFKEAGLPQELAWLPLIESGFKVKALSSARALGLWQFIPSTGYKFGLKRDTWVDERMNPEKSTAAAIAYMKELHKMFGDWTTVLAGYNCGEGTVLRKIRNQKINYLDNFWDLYQQLPRETARYVPRFLATIHIMNDPVKYGFKLEELNEPVTYESITIKKAAKLKDISEGTGISFEELVELNPELRSQVTPPTDYALRLPLGKTNLFLAHLDKIPVWIPEKTAQTTNAYVYHKVKKGETLSLIAEKYHTSAGSIVKLNKMKKKNLVLVGQKLKIPVMSNAYASNDIMPGGNYRIKKGDTLTNIAKKFKTNTKKLQKINNMTTSRLNAGQVLKIYD